MAKSTIGWFLALLGVAGCDGKHGTSEKICTAATGTIKSQFVANKVTLPRSPADFALDLNGDRKADNAFGKLVSGLTSIADPQISIDDALSRGGLIILFDETSSDATFTKDACAKASVTMGNPTTGAPDFSGSGSFTKTAGVPQPDLFGPIKASRFASNDPSKVTSPVEIQLNLPLIAGVDPLVLHLTAAHLQFTNSGGGLTDGQINGAVRDDEVQKTVIPNVARLLQQQIDSGSNSATLLAQFDTGGAADASCAGSGGGCKNPDGSCAKRDDRKIDVCEVSTNFLISSLLKPDVQLFAADKMTYMPNPANDTPDSLSFGLGFTAVKATF